MSVLLCPCGCCAPAVSVPLLLAPLWAWEREGTLSWPLAVCNLLSISVAKWADGSCYLVWGIGSYLPANPPSCWTPLNSSTAPAWAVFWITGSDPSIFPCYEVWKWFLETLSSQCRNFQSVWPLSLGQKCTFHWEEMPDFSSLHGWMVILLKV